MSTWLNHISLASQMFSLLLATHDHVRIPSLLIVSILFTPSINSKLNMLIDVRRVFTSQYLGPTSVHSTTNPLNCTSIHSQATSAQGNMSVVGCYYQSKSRGVSFLSCPGRIVYRHHVERDTVWRSSGAMIIGMLYVIWLPYIAGRMFIGDRVDMKSNVLQHTIFLALVVNAMINPFLSNGASQSFTCLAGGSCLGYNFLQRIHSLRLRDCLEIRTINIYFKIQQFQPYTYSTSVTSNAPWP